MKKKKLPLLYYNLQLYENSRAILWFLNSETLVKADRRMQNNLTIRILDLNLNICSSPTQPQGFGILGEVGSRKGKQTSTIIVLRTRPLGHRL
jgi:hypothetical protein